MKKVKVIIDEFEIIVQDELDDLEIQDAIMEKMEQMHEDDGIYYSITDENEFEEDDVI